MRVALKVDVESYRGTLDGVPALLRLFDRYQVRATFLFSLGPDASGRALRGLFGPELPRRVPGASLQGLETLLYGALLPAPHIGRRAGDTLRAVAAAGHEVGLHSYQGLRWRELVTHRDAAWTERELTRAAAAFEQVFGRPATTHGAAGWQLNQQALRLEQAMGLGYASDVRGRFPFRPLLAEGASRCPQLPTTLPTLDELLGWDGVDADNVHERVYDASLRLLPAGHLCSLRAESEGIHLLPVLEKLLVMWRGSSAELGALEDTVATLDLESLPCHRVGWGRVAGRTGHLAVQGPMVD